MRAEHGRAGAPRRFSRPGAAYGLYATALNPLYADQVDGDRLAGRAPLLKRLKSRIGLVAASAALFPLLLFASALLLFAGPDTVEVQVAGLAGGLIAVLGLAALQLWARGGLSEALSAVEAKLKEDSTERAVYPGAGRSRVSIGEQGMELKSENRSFLVDWSGLDATRFAELNGLERVDTAAAAGLPLDELLRPPPERLADPLFVTFRDSVASKLGKTASDDPFPVLRVPLRAERAWLSPKDRAEFETALREGRPPKKAPARLNSETLHLPFALFDNEPGELNTVEFAMAVLAIGTRSADRPLAPTPRGI
ncbi:MAG: hypothetical protein ACOC0V_00870 [Oceanicaulis sp.]